MTDALIGQTLLHYLITAKIGAGGMGTVYLAQDTRLNRQVALKCLPEALSRDSAARQRLVREAQAASRLNHANIVTIHAVEESDGRDFIVMEYLKGRTLAEIIAEGRRPRAEALDLAIQIAEGLAAAHQAGVVHRDLKPANIIIDEHGRAKILDFGLATFREAVRLSLDGSTLGTLAYCSPEQALGAETDFRSDLFSFGVVLYEMLAARRPFGGHHEAAIIYAIVNEQPAPLPNHNGDIGEDLQRIVSRCLAKRPEERYPAAADLLADLKTARAGGTVGARTISSRPPAIPSIAVLPMSNLSPDREQEYFCDGITEEIIHALTHVEGIRVVARTSVLVFRNKSEDIRTIGRALNADVVLEGSVRTAGGRVRINVQLISVADGYHIWSERYDREMADVFAIQDEITLAIVDKLKVTLLAGEKAKVVKRYTDDLEAFQLYLEGRYYWNRRFEGGLQRGIECFQRAIARDPNYAPAYSGISDCYCVLGYFGVLPPREVYTKAKEAAARALAIDEELAEAHTSMGWVRTYYDWDWPGGAAAYERALQLNPKYATAHQWYALHLCVDARFDEAVAAGRRAVELDPLSPIINGVLGVVLYMARRYEKGIDAQVRVLSAEPAFALSYWFLAGNYLALRRYDEAIAALEKYLALTGAPIALGSLGLTLGLAGHKDRAKVVLGQLRQMARERYVSPLHEAMIHMGLDDNESAFAKLHEAVDVRESLLVYLKVWPWVDHVREDPRFAGVLERIGLSA